MNVVLKWALSWAMSAVAKELAGEVVVITLRKLAKKTETDLDDEIVEAVARKLNVQ